MADISNRQIAQLLVGIARAQQAIVDAVESSRPGFRSTHLSPALMNAARVRDTHRALQFSDLPARILLQCMGRNGADVDRVHNDLEEIIAREAAEESARSLDMTKG